MIEKLRRTNILLVGILTVVGFAIFISINLLVFGNLPPSTYGILHYEFAWSVEKVELIFSTWGAEIMGAQTRGIWWDFPYIIGYSLFISGLIWLVARLNTGKMQNIGLFLLSTPFLAGFLDVIENIFLLIMLYDPGSIIQLYPRIAAVAAGIKFGLLIVGIFFFLFALVYGIIAKLRTRKS
ncbi:MAG: hypothetical protein EU535_07655 [Promethearchaeota archaeon]|nr:MAG: hypothetical protein EU535_07655 [Candidatus Lokiarchaeota archaeon]